MTPGRQGSSVAFFRWFKKPGQISVLFSVMKFNPHLIPVHSAHYKSICNVTHSAQSKTNSEKQVKNNYWWYWYCREKHSSEKASVVCICRNSGWLSSQLIDILSPMQKLDDSFQINFIMSRSTILDACITANSISFSILCFPYN